MLFLCVAHVSPVSRPLGSLFHRGFVVSETELLNYFSLVAIFGIISAFVGSVSLPLLGFARLFSSEYL